MSCEKKLGIIFCGQIRTFFREEVQTSFINMLNKCNNNYNYIYLVFVINGTCTSSIVEYLENLKSNYKVSEYKKIIFDSHTAIDINDRKTNANEKFLNLMEEYKENKFGKVKVEVPCVKTKRNGISIMNQFTFQFYQLKQGIKELLNKEVENNFKFDTILKTRYDTTYPDYFYPHYKDDTDSLDNKIFFDEKIKEYMKIEDIIQYQKTLEKSKIIMPRCRVVNRKNSLGGAFYYNKSIINIINGSNDILYCFNDSFFCSKRDIFIKLENFFDMFGMLKNDDIVHFYAPEAQLIIFCLENNITPIMYMRDFSTVRQHRIHTFC